MNSPFDLTSQAEQPRRIKTALFVDFDNIYVGLDKIDPEAAQSFATYPARWLSWIEQGMPSRENGASAPHQQRALLIRRCYLNPSQFGRFRPYFKYLRTVRGPLYGALFCAVIYGAATGLAGELRTLQAGLPGRRCRLGAGGRDDGGRGGADGGDVRA